jgi:hypothetical protein
MLRRGRRRGVSCEQLAMQIGRSVCSVRSRSSRLRLVTDRHWSKEEIERAVAMKGKSTTKQIAAATGRSESGVYQLFFRLGLVRQRYKRNERELHAHMRRCHRLGWSDTEAADAWNRDHPGDRMDRHFAAKIRKDLGIPSHASTPHRRARVAARTREQLAKAGLNSTGEIRRRAYIDFCRRRGWPGVVRPRLAMILDQLYVHGPMTRRELCHRIGMPWKGSRKSLHGNGPGGSYMAEGMQLGLIVCLGRLNVVHGQGRGKSTCVYAIAPGVKRRFAA